MSASVTMCIGSCPRSVRRSKVEDACCFPIMPLRSLMGIVPLTVHG